MAENQYLAKSQTLHSVFTPAQPIKNKSIFSGRIHQLATLISVGEQPGAHVILYGERGVGKSSLANVAALMMSTTYHVVKRSCDSTDSYEALAKSVLRDIKVPVETRLESIGFKPEVTLKKGQVSLADVVNGQPLNPKLLVDLLRAYGKPLVIILDEFDALGPGFERRVFAETIKSLADDVPSVTVVIVGVGDTVTEVIGEHQSIERNLRQIHLPVMTPDELGEILDHGLNALDLAMDLGVRQQIIEFSNGYPYVTHLLGLYSCQYALVTGSAGVIDEHLTMAVREGLEAFQESLRRAYQDATLETQKSIWKDVLLACAQVPVDDNGTFRAADVAAPLSARLGRPMNVTQFGYHLGRLCRPERGQVLVQVGLGKHHRYKFRNPLMRAYLQLHRHNLASAVGAPM